MRPKLNSQHFEDNIFKLIFLEVILIQIPPRGIIFKGPTDRKSALAKVMV